MSNVDWDAVEVSTTRKNSENMKAFIEGALRRPDLSGKKIADKLGMAAGSDTPVGPIRLTAEVLTTLGEIRINGKLYSMQPVLPRPELVKKPA